MEDRVLALCDRNCDRIGSICGVPVIKYEEAKQLGNNFLIPFADLKVANEVLEIVRNDGCVGYLFDEFYKILGEDQTSFLREWCAYHHAKHNDEWFDAAEKNEALEVFWGENSPFYQKFCELNLSNVIELACGRGRHLSRYIGDAEQITLVDILEENINYCQERFKGNNKIVYYHNNGFNLEKLQDNSYTALFTYDSMVHFEMMDVKEYLQDIYRVLRRGGKALFHHSNYSADYKADFAHAPHARCFMNKDLFAYLANRVGFKILSQEVIDWYGISNLDCITLVEK